MPNWCSNTITLRHSDPAMIDRALKALNAGEFLNEFLPIPEALKDEGWYSWCVDNWGTKWDVGGDDVAERLDDNTLGASFDSAWAPPVNAFASLCDMGFEIKAYYYEPGMCFCGVFEGNQDGWDDDYREYSDETSDTVREAIGEELDDYYGISEEMADWEAENQDDEEE